MAMNRFMHSLNIYNTPPDFTKLADEFEEFRAIVKTVNFEMTCFCLILESFNFELVNCVLDSNRAEKERCILTLRTKLRLKPSPNAF